MAPLADILVLFDIDGTLVDCGVTAGVSFSQAFQEVYGIPCPIFSPEEVSGLTDSAILREIARRLCLDFDEIRQREMLVFDRYAHNLAAELQKQPARMLPGARQAVQAVRDRPGCAAGLLTGSTERTAKIKLESAGIEPSQFVCGAYSEDGERRDSLPPVARGRFAKIFAREPKSTLLIGDTPRDVEAAIATRCLFIGVTTGLYDRSVLEKAGAQVVLRDLAESDLLLRAIERLVGGLVERKPS